MLPPHGAEPPEQATGRMPVRMAGIAMTPQQPQILLQCGAAFKFSSQALGGGARGGGQSGALWSLCGTGTAGIAVPAPALE